MTFEEMRARLIHVLDAAQKQDGFDTANPCMYVPAWWLDDLEHLIEKLNNPCRSAEGT